MSAQTESVVELLGKLCDLHLGKTNRCHLVQPKTERDVHFHRLRRKAFDTLFSFLKSPESKHSGVGAGGVRVEVDSVLQRVYFLRVGRHFEDADRLEHLLEQYLVTPSEAKGCVLKFLVGLAGTGTPVLSSPLGHDTYNTPVVSEDTKREINLPGGPLCYGDYKQSSVLGSAPLCPYMHFPAELFAMETCRAGTGLRETPQAARPVSIFTLPPGTGIGGSGLFSAEKLSPDSHERQTRLSLFGGLIQPRDTSMAVKLDLPDLPDDPQTSPPEITIPKSVSMSELSEDEGFITTEGSLSAMTPGDSFVEEDIWELALTTTPCQNYVWERIGCEPMATERPYLTEAGPEVVDELYHVRQHHEHLLDPSSASPRPARQLSTAQLIKDIVYLLIGIPSRTFPFVQDQFTIDTATSTSGISPEALRSVTADFVTCGTHYQRLTEFSAAAAAPSEEVDSTYTKGLVLQAFKGGVRSVLQHYRAAVLSLPTDLSLLALSSHCGKAVRQIRFLAELCHCRDRTLDGQTSDAGFPLGVGLISYLYQEAVNAVNTDNYLLMLSLLRTACQPFVLFVQDWVFHGTFRDVYGEFMIQMNHRFLEARDETYWEKGYTLTTEDEAASVPTFLAHLAPAIFRCGKALNLLRMCCPNHFLCGVSDNEIPRVSISYARSDLRDISVQCEMYVSRMQQVARQQIITRAQQQRRAQEAQRELLETARRMAAMEIARLQGILDARKQKADVKKRKEFQRLKDQMTADLQRRAGEEAEARREDEEYMARLTRQEEVLTEQEIELERQARDELIAYYTDLGEEAARRERRALWRIRRARLETARIRMLASEEEKWRTEMAEYRHAQGLLDREDEANPLPEWAQNQDTATETLQVGGAKQWDSVTTDTGDQARDWSLPKWAERHPSPGPSSSDLTVTATRLSISDSSGTIVPSVSEGHSQDSGRENSVSSSSLTSVVKGPLSSAAAAAAENEEGGEGAAPAMEQASEDRMPAWARRVLHQTGGDGGLETLVVTDNDKEDAVDDNAASSPRQPGSSHSVESVDPAPAAPNDAPAPAVPKSDPALAAPKSDPALAVPKSDPALAAPKEEGSEPELSCGGGGVGGSGSDSSLPDTPRSARTKTGVGMVEGVSTDQETEEQTTKQHIKMSDSVQATTESSGPNDARPHVKPVPGMSVSKETEAEESQKLNIMLSKTMHATKETEEEEQRPHLKVVADRGANQETQEEIRSIPRLAGSSQYNLSTETSSTEWRIKKASLFGHVSQLSKQEYSFQAPRLKRHRDLHASLESDFRDFAVKPRIRMHKQRAATAESEERVDRPMIRSFRNRHANIESEYVDVEGIRRKRFLEHNVFGHSSDSTVQRLLYFGRYGFDSAQDAEALPELKELVPRFELDALDLMPDDLETFEDNFERLNGRPMVDLLASMPGVVQRGGVGVGGAWQGDVTQEEADLIALTPLPVLMQQALTAPLSAQISLVDEMVVNYFLVDLKIDSHFEALHRYLFMADGDFAQNLTDILLEKLSSCHLPQEMLTPVFLNSALNRALQLSASVNQQHADSLSFALRYMPDFFRHNAHDTLDCLELRYKVGWPLNVVLTEGSQACYGQVFSFMLQLKRVAWTLTDCWYRLKRDAIVKKAKDSGQFRQLQLHRQEMQHFVKVMQGYMANQIIQVTWRELQEALDQQVHSLDDLRQVHAQYLHKALFRCLLNKKAAPIMKIIQDIFCLILKFCAQLSGATWEEDPGTREVTHPNFAAMATSYKAFREYFVFLFKVVNKLAVRGYQPHLNELLLRLNFNDYYSTK